MATSVNPFWSHPLADPARFVLHLDDTTREELLERIQALLDEYEATDDERRAVHQPRFGGLFVIHELASSE